MSHTTSKAIWRDNCNDHLIGWHGNLKSARKEAKKHGWTFFPGKYSLKYQKTVDFDLCPKCKAVTRDDLYTISLSDK